MDVRMQEWLPPHHVPQNVEAEPTQWFPNWVLGGTPWAIKGTQASGAHPGFTRAILPVPVSHVGFHVGYCGKEPVPLRNLLAF